MLLNYIDSAMKLAKYEILKDDNTYYGEIPTFNGVWANADNLEKCREELREVIEEWILLRVSKNLPIPKIESINLNIDNIA